MRSKTRKTEIIIGSLLLIASILAAVAKILVGFDIDEGYALALPYRFLMGDRLFTQMWEVHQTSALFASVILYPFIRITGTTTCLVLYVRIVCTLLHLLVSACVYLTLKRFIPQDTAAFLAVVYFNFLPKWMMSVDFSMQFIWFFTLCLLLLMRAEHHRLEGKERRFLADMLLCGVSLALLVLGYPSMVLLYPVIVFFLFGKKDREKWRGRGCIALTAGCGAPAVLFMAWLFSYLSLAELIEDVKLVFADGSHQFDGYAKWSLWIGHAWEVLVQTLITLVPAVITVIAFAWILQRWKRGSREDETGNAQDGDRIPLLLWIVGVYLFLTSLIVLIAPLIGIPWGPFRLQIRYIVMFVMGFCLAHGKDSSARVSWFYRLCLWLPFWAFVFILLASNVGPAPSASYLVAGVMTMLCLFATRVSEIKERVSDRQTQIFVAGAKAAMLLFLISLILCKGFYVRVTEYPPSDIRMERVVLDRGPAKGIYVYPEEYDQMMETYDEMAEFTDSSDRVLYLGTQALSNLYTKGELSIPTTISTPAFNEQWIAYFEKYPDKMPTVIFLSKTTVDDQEKFFAMNPFGQWIAAHYDTAQRMDKEYVCVIFSKERMEMIHKTPKDDVTQFHEG